MVDRLGDVEYYVQHINKFTRHGSTSPARGRSAWSTIKVSKYLFAAPFAAMFGWRFADLVARTGGRPSREPLRPDHAGDRPSSRLAMARGRGTEQPRGRLGDLRRGGGRARSAAGPPRCSRPSSRPSSSRRAATVLILTSRRRAGSQPALNEWVRGRRGRALRARSAWATSAIGCALPTGAAPPRASAPPTPRRDRAALARPSSRCCCSFPSYLLAARTHPPSRALDRLRLLRQALGGRHVPARDDRGPMLVITGHRPRSCGRRPTPPDAWRRLGDGRRSARRAMPAPAEWPARRSAGRGRSR